MSDFKHGMGVVIKAEKDWRGVGRRKALSLSMRFIFFLFFFINTPRSAAVHGHEKYSGGSIVGKASTISINISPTLYLITTHVTDPSPNFHRGSNSAKFGFVFNITRGSLNFERPAFVNAVRFTNSETNFLYSHDRPMSSPTLVKWVYTPLRTLSVKLCPTP